MKLMANILKFKLEFHLVIMLLLYQAFACTKTDYETRTVIKNCTGVYLRIDSKDYFVCNPEKLAKYGNNAEIKVAYSMCSECTSDGPVCLLVYPNNGWLKINKVK